MTLLIEDNRISDACERCRYEATMCHFVTFWVGGVPQDFSSVKDVPWLKKG